MFNDAGLGNDAPGSTAVVMFQSGRSPMDSSQVVRRVDQVILVHPRMINIMYHGGH